MTGYNNLFEQGLRFGNFADDYHDARLTYPRTLVDDVCTAASLRLTDRVLEVGAGTGQATRLFGPRCGRLECLEPSHAMAQILKRAVSDLHVVVHELSFEDWKVSDHAFDLVLAAQSWHWVNPAVRVQKAWAALRTGGTLALFWNDLPMPVDRPTRPFHRLYEVIHRNPSQTKSASPQGQEPLRTTGLFGNFDVKHYRTPVQLTIDQYLALLNTYPEYADAPRALTKHREKAVEHIFETDSETGLAMTYGTILHLAISLNTVPYI